MNLAFGEPHLQPLSLDTKNTSAADELLKGWEESLPATTVPSRKVSGSLEAESIQPLSARSSARSSFAEASTFGEAVHLPRRASSVSRGDMSAVLRGYSQGFEPTSLRTLPIEAAAEAVGQIELDLPRTHADEGAVRTRIGVIRQMLLRHAKEDVEVGYCQGLSCVAAAFAVASSGLEEAYSRFRHFTARVRGLWLPGFPLLQTGSEQFADLARRRPWFQHLEKHGVDCSMYLPQAWMALFFQWLPLPTLVSCLEIMEREGFAGMAALTLGFLDLAAEELLRHQDTEPLLMALKFSHRRAPQASVLLACAERWLPKCAANRLDGPGTDADCGTCEATGLLALGGPLPVARTMSLPSKLPDPAADALPLRSTVSKEQRWWHWRSAPASKEQRVPLIWRLAQNLGNIVVDPDACEGAPVWAQHVH